MEKLVSTPNKDFRECSRRKQKSEFQEKANFKEFQANNNGGQALQGVSFSGHRGRLLYNYSDILNALMVLIRTQSLTAGLAPLNLKNEGVIAAGWIPMKIGAPGRTKIPRIFNKLSEVNPDSLVEAGAE